MTNELAKIIVNVHERAERSERSTQVQRDTVDKVEAHFEKIKPNVNVIVRRDLQAGHVFSETATITDAFVSGANQYAFPDEGMHDRYAASGIAWPSGRSYYDYAHYAGILPMDGGSIAVVGGVESRLVAR